MSLYTPSNTPAPSSQGRSATMRDEFNLIADAFDLTMPKNSPVGTGAGDFSAMDSFLVPTLSPGDNSNKAATTKFVQDMSVAAGALPSPVGHDGKALLASGGSAAWGYVVGLTDTQTLTNKTMALGSNSLSGTLAQFNAAVTDANFASLTGAETLTNKTLESPVLTDTPSCPTAMLGTSTTQVSSTAFVAAALAAMPTPPAFSAF